MILLLILDQNLLTVMESAGWFVTGSVLIMGHYLCRFEYFGGV